MRVNGCVDSNSRSGHVGRERREGTRSRSVMGSEMNETTWAIGFPI